MAKRNKLNKKPTHTAGGSYFDEVTLPSCIPSGCGLLDQVLGGGWAEGRVANIVGDKSTGKTLLAIEACANFARKYPKGYIRYCEAEAAFDVPYAETVGLPPDRVDFAEDIFTVEDMEKDLQGVVSKQKKEPALYIVDSLDALSDKAELENEIDKGSYGAAKAKRMTQLFRRINKRLNNTNVTLIIISQVRDNIGVMFGKQTTRSGGRALDFYASQILWLYPFKSIDKTRKGVKRRVGVITRARCEKNKVGMPFRECNVPIYFSYGVDDIQAGIDFLADVKRLDAVGIKPDDAAKYLRGLDKLSDEEFQAERENVDDAVREVWKEIEKGFRPKRRKY